MRLEHLYVKTEAVVKSGLWRLFPVINVDRVREIPSDYPGAMGVPITFMDKFNNEQFEILDTIKPKINGKALYQRIIIRHLKPDLPEYIDLAQCKKSYGHKMLLGFGAQQQAYAIHTLYNQRRGKKILDRFLAQCYNQTVASGICSGLSF